MMWKRDGDRTMWSLKELEGEIDMRSLSEKLIGIGFVERRMSDA